MSIFRGNLRRVCESHFVWAIFLICEHASVNFQSFAPKYSVLTLRDSDVGCMCAKSFAAPTIAARVERNVKCGCGGAAPRRGRRLPWEGKWSEFVAVRRILADWCRAASLFSGFAPARTHLSSPQDARRLFLSLSLSAWDVSLLLVI